ncbi:hypothetical protein [Salipiger sp. H15]|uniref:hypothetical protein n=1 Tax=Alloyangia sp. H15 TaxID=3029062 RepID=UPI003364C1A8
MVLAPLHALLRLIALLLRAVRLRRASGLLGRVHLILPTRTARAVEEGLLKHVFALPADLDARLPIASPRPLRFELTLR